MQPGWYGDPFSRSGLRWWDGTAWTSHTSWQPPPGSAGAGPPGGFPSGWAGPVADPARDLADEERAAGWARYGLLIIAGTSIASYLTGAALMGSVLRDVVRQFREAVNTDGTATARVTVFHGSTLVLDGFGLVMLAAQILLWIWLYRAATLSRRAGLPARREPAWAWLGFVIPIVSLWFPYQVASDTLPPGHPARATVSRWWACWIAQTLAGIPIIVVAYFSTPVAVVLAIFACALPVLTALTARQMINEVVAVHRELIASAAR